MDKRKVKKALPPIRIGRFLKKYGGPKRKAASRESGPQYPILLPYVKPAGYIPPACEQSIFMCRALQVLEYAKNPESYNMKKKKKVAGGEVVG